MDFEWFDENVLHRGRGFTRDISSKGMFIYSDFEPPAKADLRVKVSFRTDTEAPANLWLSAQALVVRVGPAASRDAPRGFAILNRSYKLHNGRISIDEGDPGFETS